MGMVATDQVIKEMCKETGYPGFDNYTTIEGYMLDAIRDLNTFNMPTWRVLELPISSFFTFDWPCSCTKPLMTALRRDKCTYLLDVSNDLLATIEPNDTTSAQNCDCEVGDLFQIDGFIEAYGWSVYSWGLGELYGLQTLLPGFGRVIHDKTNRQSFIKGCRIKTSDTIFLFFKSDGLDDCPEFIPSESKECTEYFILQKFFRTRNPSLAAVNRNNYKEEFTRLQSWLSDEGVEAWISAMYSNVRSSPKL